MEVVGVDVGGTKIHSALISMPEGKILSDIVIETDAKGGVEGVLKRIQTSISTFFADYANDIKAIGVGVPGIVDVENGIVIKCINISGFKNINLKERLEKAFSLPVVVDNDARLFALGEARFGIGKQFNSMIGLTFGTGVGGALVENGVLQKPGEFGHILFDFNGVACNCGRIGCWEQYVSGPAILRRAKEKLGFLSEEELEKTELNLKDLTVAKVFGASLTFDPVAREIVADTAKFIGVGLGQLVKTINPEAIIVGGGIAKNYWDFLHEGVELTLKKFQDYDLQGFELFKSENQVNGQLPLIVSKLENSALLGAAAIAVYGKPS